MKQEKHTSGPWNYAKSELNLNYSIYANGPLAYSAGEADYPESAEANARLIAAAPDMLEALRFVYENTDSMLIQDRILPIIQKATNLTED